MNRCGVRSLILFAIAIGAVAVHILTGDPATRDDDPLDYTIDNDNHY